MDDTWITLVGLTAATCTTASLLPQVVKAFRTKRTGDVSLLMYLILSTGLFLWLVYGLLKADLPLILANSFSFALSLAVLLLKIRHG
jgi:MtN3 and saliva related transmembrane protein